MTPPSPRRSSARTDAVLQATLELAAELPYARLSMEGIAARAGVGKHTVYRRWPSKGAVVLDALLSLQPKLSYPYTGSVVDDLRQQMQTGMDLLSQPRFAALYTALLGEVQQDPALAEAFRERWLKPLADATRARLQAAQRQGQLTPSIDVNVMIAMLYGPLYYRILVTADRYDAAFLDALLNAAFSGLRPSTRSDTES